ncbi:hypothetical protein AN476_06990 [Phaeobacter sp. 11ANDIMAR09]|nr:hypothetical protein AN476_06990 [Phaeobacter sp. 11ANDIMAR09]OIQ33374.1 MAG: hypothetical protein BM559_09850 [Roseobacter sp. MedPE-SWchi]
MSPALAYAFHPAPAAPAPAPSQIRFPRLPQNPHRAELPLPGASKTKMVLLGAENPELSPNEQGLHRQEYPTWLH